MRARMDSYIARQEAEGAEAFRGMLAPRLGRQEPAHVAFREYDPGATFVRTAAAPRRAAPDTALGGCLARSHGQLLMPPQPAA